mgnify:FL=1
MGDGKRAAHAIERYLGSVQDLLPGAMTKVGSDSEGAAPSA